MISKFPILILLAACLGSCKAKKADQAREADKAREGEPTYFSMRQFVRDQWETYKDQPYTFVKYVFKDGKVDSSYVQAPQLEIGYIMEAFVKTDIGQAKFLDKYDFSVIDEGVSITRTYYYEAKEPDLYTRKLHITTDPTNNKIQSIFVDAIDEDGLAVKLYYAPQRLIRIQEQKKKAGKLEEVKTEYRFPDYYSE
jgi:hypothetical protein